jgi:Spy/CpxP family protein refolding chaperone
MTDAANLGGSGARASKARAVLAAVSLLVVGAVAGIAIDRHLLLGGGHTSTAAAFHEMTMSSLQERLGLTADQRRQIDSIVGVRHNTLRHVWEMMHSQLGATLDTVHIEVEAILTPEQRVEFREWARQVGPGH